MTLRQHRIIRPKCNVCKRASATIVVLQEKEDFRLIYDGPGGSSGPSGTIISSIKVDAILRTLSALYSSRKIKAAGFYDDAGFWGVSGNGMHQKALRQVGRRLA